MVADGAERSRTSNTIKRKMSQTIRQKEGRKKEAFAGRGVCSGKGDTSPLVLSHKQNRIEEVMQEEEEK